MRLVENISQSLASLWANKMRSLLTMLGIIIGIGSVIAILTVGDSLTSSITENLSGFGVNKVLMVLQSKQEKGSRGGIYVPDNIDEKSLITNDMLEELQAAFPDELKEISITEMVGNGQTTLGRRYANLSLTGVNMEFADAENVKVSKGRFLNRRDEADEKKVAIVSDKLAASMFDKEDPLGQQITINAGQHVGLYTIVGVYKYDTSSNMGGQMASDQDISTDVFIPLSTAKKITRTTGYSFVNLVTKSGIDSKQFADDATRFFDKYYSRNPNFGVTLISMESMLDTVNQVMSSIETGIAAIAAISLLVGGIGVMNIMMVSITERTREIGTRKAIGATNGEIRLQFVVEAVIICLIGGLIGIVVGNGLGMFGASLLGAPARASLSTVLLATCFSMAIGVFFGYYPANKAAKMDPIDALRYE